MVKGVEMWCKWFNDLLIKTSLASLWIILGPVWKHTVTPAEIVNTLTWSKQRCHENTVSQNCLAIRNICIDIQSCNIHFSCYSFATQKMECEMSWVQIIFNMWFISIGIHSIISNRLLQEWHIFKRVAF